MSSQKGYLDKVLHSEGQEKFNAAKKLVECRDIASKGTGLIHDLKFGEKLYKQSLKKQKNIYYENNINKSNSTNAASRNIIKELKNPPIIEESMLRSTSRSKYLWSPKSTIAYDRMCVTLKTKSDADIGSDFAFLLGLHDTIQAHVNIGMVDTIFSMPPEPIPAVSDTDGAGVSYVSNIIKRQRRQELREKRLNHNANRSHSDSEDTDSDSNLESESENEEDIVSNPSATRNTEVENSTDRSLLRIFSNFKYAENSNSICKDTFLKSAIESEVYALINDFQYCVNNGDYDLTDIMKSGAEPGYRPTNAGEFPVKAVLRALPQYPQCDQTGLANDLKIENQTNTGKTSIYIRPLCTAGDVLLAMHELLDKKLFKCGSISLPHSIRGPFVRDPTGGTFFRCVFRLNQQISIYHMRPKPEATINNTSDVPTASAIELTNVDLRSFMCPRHHQDHYSFESVDNEQASHLLKQEDLARLLEECDTIVKTITATYGMSILLMHLVMDFESCYELPEVKATDMHTVIRNKFGIHIPVKTANKPNTTSHATKPVQTAAAAVKGFAKHFRLSQLSHAKFRRRVAPWRRQEVHLFHDVDKAYFELFHEHFHIEFEAYQRGALPGSVAGNSIVGRQRSGAHVHAGVKNKAAMLYEKVSAEVVKMIAKLSKQSKTGARQEKGVDELHSDSESDSDSTVISDVHSQASSLHPIEEQGRPEGLSVCEQAASNHIEVAVPKRVHFETEAVFEVPESVSTQEFKDIENSDTSDMDDIGVVIMEAVQHQVPPSPHINSIDDVEQASYGSSTDWSLQNGSGGYSSAVEGANLTNESGTVVSDHTKSGNVKFLVKGAVVPRTSLRNPTRMVSSAPVQGIVGAKNSIIAASNSHGDTKSIFNPFGSMTDSSVLDSTIPDGLEESTTSCKPSSSHLPMILAMEEFLRQYVLRETEMRKNILRARLVNGAREFNLDNRNREMLFYTAVAAATNDISSVYNPLHSTYKNGTDSDADTGVGLSSASTHSHEPPKYVTISVQHRTKGMQSYRVHLPQRSLPLSRVDKPCSTLSNAYSYTGSMDNDSQNHIDEFSSYYSKQVDPYLEYLDKETAREIELANNETRNKAGKLPTSLSGSPYQQTEVHRSNSNRSSPVSTPVCSNSSSNASLKALNSVSGSPTAARPPSPLDSPNGLGTPQINALVHSISETELFQQSNISEHLKELMRLFVVSRNKLPTKRPSPSSKLRRSFNPSPLSKPTGIVHPPEISGFDTAMHQWSSNSAGNMRYGSDFQDSVTSIEAKLESNAVENEQRYDAECAAVLEQIISAFPPGLADMIRSGLNKCASKSGNLKKKQKSVKKTKKKQTKKSSNVINSIGECNSMENITSSVTAQHLGGDLEYSSLGIENDAHGNIVMREEANISDKFDENARMRPLGMDTDSDSEEEPADTPTQCLPGDGRGMSRDMQVTHNEFLQLRSQTGGKLWGEPSISIKSGSAPENYRVISYLEQTKQEYAQLHEKMVDMLSDLETLDDESLSSRIRIPNTSMVDSISNTSTTSETEHIQKLNAEEGEVGSVHSLTMRSQMSDDGNSEVVPAIGFADPESVFSERNDAVPFSDSLFSSTAEVRGPHGLGLSSGIAVTVQEHLHFHEHRGAKKSPAAGDAFEYEFSPRMKIESRGIPAAPLDGADIPWEDRPHPAYNADGSMYYDICHHISGVDNTEVDLRYYNHDADGRAGGKGERLANMKDKKLNSNANTVGIGSGTYSGKTTNNRHIKALEEDSVESLQLISLEQFLLTMSEIGNGSAAGDCQIVTIRVGNRDFDLSGTRLKSENSGKSETGTALDDPLLSNNAGNMTLDSSTHSGYHDGIVPEIDYKPIKNATVSRRSEHQSTMNPSRACTVDSSVRSGSLYQSYFQSSISTGGSLLTKPHSSPCTAVVCGLPSVSSLIPSTSPLPILGKNTTPGMEKRPFTGPTARENAIPGKEKRPITGPTARAALRKLKSAPSSTTKNPRRGGDSSESDGDKPGREPMLTANANVNIDREASNFLIASTIIPKSREVEISRPVSEQKHTPNPPRMCAPSNVSMGMGSRKRGNGVSIASMDVETAVKQMLAPPPSAPPPGRHKLKSAVGRRRTTCKNGSNQETDETRNPNGKVLNRGSFRRSRIGTNMRKGKGAAKDVVVNSQAAPARDMQSVQISDTVIMEGCIPESEDAAVVLPSELKPETLVTTMTEDNLETGPNPAFDEDIRAKNQSESNQKETISQGEGESDDEELTVLSCPAVTVLSKPSENSYSVTVSENASKPSDTFDSDQMSSVNPPISELYIGAANVGQRSHEVRGVPKSRTRSPYGGLDSIGGLGSYWELPTDGGESLLAEFSSMYSTNSITGGDAERGSWNEIKINSRSPNMSPANRNRASSTHSQDTSGVISELYQELLVQQAGPPILLLPASSAATKKWKAKSDAKMPKKPSVVRGVTKPFLSNEAMRGLSESPLALAGKSRKAIAVEAKLSVPEADPLKGLTETSNMTDASNLSPTMSSLKLVIQFPSPSDSTVGSIAGPSAQVIVTRPNSPAKTPTPVTSPCGSPTMLMSPKGTPKATPKHNSIPAAIPETSSIIESTDSVASVGSVALDLANSMDEVVSEDTVIAVTSGEELVIDLPPLEVEAEQIIKPPVVKSVNNKFQVHPRDASPPIKSHSRKASHSGVVVHGLVMDSEGQGKKHSKQHVNCGKIDDMVIGGTRLGGEDGGRGESRHVVTANAKRSRKLVGLLENCRPNTTNPNTGRERDMRDRKALLNLFGVNNLPKSPSPVVEEKPVLVRTEVHEPKPSFILPVDRSVPTSRASSAGKTRPQPISVQVLRQGNPTALRIHNNATASNPRKSEKISKILHSPHLVDPSAFIKPIQLDPNATLQNPNPVVQTSGITLNIKKNEVTSSPKQTYQFPRSTSDDLLSELVLPKASSIYEPRPPSPLQKGDRKHGGDNHLPVKNNDRPRIKNEHDATIRSKHAIENNMKFVVKNHVT